MTRERISRLTSSDLVKLAEIFSLDPFEEYDIDEHDYQTIDPFIRRQLEDQVFELIEESRAEQKGSDALPVQYHQKHFLSLEEFFGQKLEGEDSFYVFPDQYNVTRIMLMLRDPEWAYTYWDISNKDRTDILQKTEFRNFLIILKEQPDQSASGVGPQMLEEPPLDMEIPVHISDNSWYINLPNRPSHYTVELAVDYSDRREVLARSGQIIVPGGTFSRDLENINARETEVLLALSGIEDAGVSAFEGVPRKIVEVMEEESD